MKSIKWNQSYEKRNMTTNITWRPNLIDVIKVFAIIVMIIDHLWYFLFPEYIWMRFVWRFSFPLFIIAIGLHWSYRVDSWLLYSAIFIQIVLVWYWFINNIGFQPISILWSIIFIKFVLDFLSSKLPSKNNLIYLISVWILCTVWWYRTSHFIEYWTLWISVWILWYLIRLGKSQKVIIPYLLVCIIWIILVNQDFHFGSSLMVLYSLLMIIIFWSIDYFKDRLFLQVTKNPMFNLGLSFLSKNALPIYVIHLFIIILIAYFD